LEGYLACRAPKAFRENGAARKLLQVF
jgi:hypothetical protein